MDGFKVNSIRAFFLINDILRRMNIQVQFKTRNHTTDFSAINLRKFTAKRYKNNWPKNSTKQQSQLQKPWPYKNSTFFHG